MVSGDRREPRAERRHASRSVRGLAVASVAVVVLAYLSVLTFVVNVTGDPTTMYAVAVGSAVAGAVVGRVVRPRYALVAAAGILVVGAWLYLGSLPTEAAAAGSFGRIAADSLSLLTGLSILRIVNADVWAMAVVPAPTFLAAYLTVRERYVAGAGVAGATLAIFVLTGDATAPVALLGAVGVAGAMGFGDLARRGESLPRAEVVAVILAVLVVVPAAVSLVPGGSASPLRLGGGGDGGGGGTVETSLLDSGSSFAITGSITLSPKVRFRVESDRSSYWRVGSYDRYTGRGWVRTGGSRPLGDGLAPPPGASSRVEQEYTMLAGMESVPAAWKPVSVEGIPGSVQVESGVGLTPNTPLDEGQTYSVSSRVPTADPATLREAGTGYPDHVVQRYTQLPDSTPDRVAERTARLTANAENPYDTARVVERWLQNNREYSLDVRRPDGDVADAFLFEMQAGYCTYFATTMVTMLRTQGIPARLAVGYTTGEQVGDGAWVARGLDSHAWVEVYFPDQGWVRFDPTPADPRRSAEQSRLDQARANNQTDVDAAGTGTDDATPTPEPTPTFGTPSGGTNDTRTPRLGRFGAPGGGDTSTPSGDFGQSPGGDDDGPLPDLPSREQAALLAVVAFGAVSAVRRTGIDRRAYRAVWLRVQPRSDPETDVRRAWKRLEHVLGERERPRRPGETVRQYAAAVDDADARRLADLYERAVYAGGVTAEQADEAVAIADGAVASRSRFPWP